MRKESIGPSRSGLTNTAVAKESRSRTFASLMFTRPTTTAMIFAPSSTRKSSSPTKRISVAKKNCTAPYKSCLRKICMRPYSSIRIRLNFDVQSTSPGTVTRCTILRPSLPAIGRGAFFSVFPVRESIEKGEAPLALRLLLFSPFLTKRDCRALKKEAASRERR